LIQAVSGGNAGSVGFALLPQNHSSCSHTAILSHRRLLEDKAVAFLDLSACLLVRFLMEICCSAGLSFCDLRSFDVFEISLNFSSDGAHGGDKRKTSQMCT